MKVKVLKAEGKGKKKGSFINHLIFDAPIDLFQWNNRLFAFGGHWNEGSPDCLSSTDVRDMQFCGRETKLCSFKVISFLT